MNRRLLTPLTLALLAGCSSAATHYYTLTTPLTPDTRVSDNGPQFELQSVRMPVQVDQPQLVVRQGGGGLSILENERWAAPLADEFHDALADQLERHLGSRDLAGMPKSSASPVLRITTDVRRFDSIPGQQAAIDAVWNLGLRQQDGKVRNLTCSTRISVAAGVEVASLVQAHQQAVAQLAQKIAGTGRAWYSDAGVGCPRD